MRLVLFDCDGTLVDSAGVIHACMAATFGDFGRDAPTDAATRSVIGLSLDRAIGRLAGEGAGADIAAMTMRYKQHFVMRRADPDFHEPIFPGIAALIADLRGRPDVLLGIVTGKSRRGLSAVLATHQFASAFVTSRTADDCPSKPHPAMVLECCGETGIAPKDCVVVGDAVFDIEMAVSAGAAGIGVSWGYGGAAALKAAGARAVIDAPADLYDHLDGEGRQPAHAVQETGD